MESKKDIRRHVLEKRNQITEKEWEEKCRRIYEKVTFHPFFLESDIIYCYVDYRNEVGTRSIIQKAWECKKQVAVPRIEEGEMNFYYIHSFDDLSSGYKGILEPITDFPALDEHALVIVPGVAFDKARNRIGYGKGYYDKFMSQHPTYHTIALSFEEQMVESIAAEMHDFCPEIIITEEQIYDSKFTE